MFTLETRAKYDTMESILKARVKMVKFPGRMNAAKRGVEYITPRINWFLGWDKYYRFVHKTIGDSKPLTPKVEAVASAIAYLHDLDDQRVQRIKDHAASFSWKTFLKWEEGFKTEFQPTLIEWMLGVSVYYDTYKDRRDQVHDIQAVGRKYKTMIRNKGYAERALEKAAVEEAEFQKFLDGHLRVMEKRVAAREEQQLRLDNIVDEMEEFEEQFAHIAVAVRAQLERESDSTESD